MRWWNKLLIPVLALGLVGIADAKGKKGGDALVGKIVSVSTDSITITSGKKKAGDQKTITVQTTATTSITIDGVGGKSIKDLQAGEHVRVTPSTGNATEIQATTKHHKKKTA
jgi:hypothetical protein